MASDSGAIAGSAWRSIDEIAGLDGVR
jgi:hypothetical protein